MGEKLGSGAFKLEFLIRELGNVGLLSVNGNLVLSGIRISIVAGRRRCLGLGTGSWEFGVAIDCYS